MTHELINRKNAREKARKFYYSGRPCKMGHLAQRRVYDGRCVECDIPAPTCKHGIDLGFCTVCDP